LVELIIENQGKQFTCLDFYIKYMKDYKMIRITPDDVDGRKLAIFKSYLRYYNDYVAVGPFAWGVYPSINFNNRACESFKIQTLVTNN
jgi:hypothetical protein